MKLFVGYVDENGQIERISDLEERFVKALEIGLTYGAVNGETHKMWCIDQMMRALLKDEYEEVITEYKKPVNGHTYEWSEGVEPWL